MTTQALSHGQIDIPDGWTTSTQVTFIAPDKEAPALPIATRGSAEEPPARVSIQRERTEHPDAATAMAAFVVAMGSDTPGWKVRGKGSLTFADGAAGASIVVTFEPMPGRVVAQRHIIRVDEGILTQISATVPQGRQQLLDRDLLATMLSFRP